MGILSDKTNALVEALLGSADKETGEIDTADLEAFVILSEEEIAPTFDALQARRREIENNAELLKAEIARLQKRKKALENNAAGLAFYMQVNLEALGGKLKTLKNTFFIGERESLFVAPEALANVPPSCLKVKTEVDKTALLKWIKETGEIFDGVEIRKNLYLGVR